MPKFEYVKPSSVGEADKLLQEKGENALVMAGGTAVVLLLQRRFLRPELVIDLGGISGLNRIEPDGNALYVGALTPIRSIEKDRSVHLMHGLLAEAAGQVANVRVRNAATIGGSVCFGEPQTDIPPALIAMGAIAILSGPNGERKIPVEEFFLGPYETRRSEYELLTHLYIPPTDLLSGGCHMKFTLGSPENKPVVNVSVLVNTDESRETLINARIVMGAVGGTPILAEKASAALSGERWRDSLIDQVAHMASEEADPIQDLRGSAWYKRRVTKRLVEKALWCAIGRVNSKL